MGNEKKMKTGPNKIAALITYVIALIGLLLGLFLPFAGTEMKVEAMLGLQLPAAINAIYPLEFLKDIAGNYPLTLSAPLAKWGEFTLDLSAILLVLYGLITLAGLFALIPAIVNAASKKSTKNVALSAASFIEVCAAAVLATLLLTQLSGGVKKMTCYTLMGAFGGVFLMLVVQALIYKKGSGFIKIVLALLSSVAVIAGVFNLVEIIPQLGDLLAPLKQDWLAIGFVGGETAIGDSAIFAIDVFILTTFSGTFALPEGAAEATLYLTTVIAGLLALINCVLDIMGLGKKTNKAMLICNVVRYSLEFAAIICVLVCAIVIETATMGLFLLALLALALIALVINIIRLACYIKAKKRAKATVTSESEDGEVKESKKERKQREKEERAAAKAAAAEQAKAEKEAAKAAKAAKTDEEPAADAASETAATAPTAVYVEDGKGNIVYTPVIYNGPMDDFIRTLNNEQRLEFSRIFLERQAGALTCIPNYNVGGKNDKFFSSVFIYYGRVRDLISDGLMNEIYKQANMM